jgi:hypothetical protein
LNLFAVAAFYMFVNVCLLGELVRRHGCQREMVLVQKRCRGSAWCDVFPSFTEHRKKEWWLSRYVNKLCCAAAWLLYKYAMIRCCWCAVG